jgi:hypothetical protein
MAEQAAEVLNTQDGPIKVNAEESPAKTETVGELDPQAKANDGETEPEGQKRKGGWQRKIEKLEKQRDALVERLLAKEPEKQQAQTEKPAETPKAKPEPKDFDLGDGTYDHGKYTEAVSEYNAQKAVSEYKKAAAKEESERKAKEEQGQRIETWQQRLKTAGDKIQDLAEVLADSEAVATPTMQRAIVQSDLGPQIAYELAKNPAESERIAKLDPEMQLFELGKIAARLAQPEPAEKEEAEKPPTPPISKAPPPVTPVKKPAPVGKSFDPNDVSISPDEWLKKRLEQEGKKR